MNKDILTPDDLAERWGLGADQSAIWRAVDDRRHGLPFIYLGRGRPQPDRAGQRGLYRFKRTAVERWEEEAQKSFTSDSGADDAKAAQSLAGVGGYDGVLRGGRKGKKGPKRTTAAQ